MTQHFMPSEMVRHISQGDEVLRQLLAEVKAQTQAIRALGEALEALQATGRHRRSNQALSSLLRAIYSVLGPQSFSARHLFACAARDEPLAKQLVRFLDRNSGVVSLGRYLGSNVGQSAGGYRLQGHSVSGSGVYEVVMTSTNRHDLLAADGRQVP